MFWILSSLMYLGVALVWTRWHVWTVFSWPLHLIVDDEDARQENRLTFRTFARRTLPENARVPFAITWPVFAALGLLCWLYAVTIFVLVRFSCALSDR